MTLFDKPGMFFALEPPHMPCELPELDRATMLLGHMAQGVRVKQRLLQELEQLLGGLPHPDVAVAWKTALKRHRRTLLARKAG